MEFEQNMPVPENILAFAASNSRQSINKMLVEHACNVLEGELLPAVNINVLDLNHYEMPIYSIDRETEEGIPEAAHSFYKAIGDADALLISYAEHNGLYSVAFKNIFDWCSRIDKYVFQNKPMVIMSTSPGANGGANVLKTAINSGKHFGAEILGHLSVGRFRENFDVDEGLLTNPELAASLRVQLGLLLKSNCTTND